MCQDVSVHIRFCLHSLRAYWTRKLVYIQFYSGKGSSVMMAFVNVNNSLQWTYGLFFICWFHESFILCLQSNNVWLYIYQMMLILIMFWQNIFTAKSCMAHGAGKRFFSSMNSNVSFCISQTLYLQKAKWTLIFLTSQIYWIISSFLHLLQAKNKKKLKTITRIFCKQTAFR